MSQHKVRWCPSCGGTGHGKAVGKDERVPRCPDCGGTGFIPENKKTRANNDDWKIDDAFSAKNILVGFFDSILWPIYGAVDLIKWIFLQSDIPLSVTNNHIVLMLFLGPIIAYILSIGPVLLVWLLIAGNTAMRDPFLYTQLKLGLYGALFGAFSTITCAILALLAGKDRASIFQAQIIGVRIAIVGGLLWGLGIFIATFA